MSKQEVDLPIIGKQIQWKDINAQCRSGLLKVDHFTEFAVIENGKVKAVSATMPYGILTVTCIEMNAQFIVWITHKIDFQNLKLAYQYKENLNAYNQLLNDRVHQFENKAGDQLAQLTEIHTWLGTSEKPEILVGYFTRKAQKSRGWFTRLLESSLPKLYIWMCPEGYLQRVVKDNLAPLTGRLYFDILRPLAKWEPEI